MREEQARGDTRHPGARRPRLARILPLRPRRKRLPEERGPGSCALESPPRAHGTRGAAAFERGARAAGAGARRGPGELRAPGESGQGRRPGTHAAALGGILEARRPPKRKAPPGANGKPEPGDHLKAPPARGLQRTRPGSGANICCPGGRAGQVPTQWPPRPAGPPACAPGG